MVHIVFCDIIAWTYGHLKFPFDKEIYDDKEKELHAMLL
jgi:hypothetical protein